MSQSPTDFVLSANIVDENAALGAIIGTFQDVVDPDAGDTHTFALLDDAGGRFQIVGDELQVADGTLLDFEGASSYTITVRVTDSTGLTVDKIFTIDLTDVNEAPTDVALSANTVAEGAATETVVGTLQGVVDPDAGDTHTYSLVDDAGGRFKLVGGELRVADGTLLDFETVTSYQVTVRVTDAAGLSFDKTLTIDLTDVNEAPTDIALSAATVSESAATGTVVGTLQGVVDDAGDTHTFALLDDAGGRFQLVGNTLEVANGALLDFEAAVSHAVTVRVTDAAGLFFDKAFTVDVTNVNEAPTDFTLTASNVAEHASFGTVVGTFQGIVDPDTGDTHTFSLVDDAGGRFQIVGNALQVLDGTLLDFESAASHAVTVRVTDGGLFVDKTFTIDIGDVNEAPTDVALSASTVAEGATAGTIVGTLQGVVDPDAGNSHTFSLVDDAGGRFQIVGDALQVLDGALLDFESAASYAVTVRVTDGGLFVDKTFTIDVGDVNEAPTAIALSASVVAEGAATDTVVGTLQGIVDPDAGDSHTFSLVDNAGGRFKLVGTALQVADGTLVDFEGAASHAVTVRVTDAAGLFYDEIFTVDVTDVNEAPTVGDQAFALAENQLAGTVVGTVAASDPDAANTLSYAITAGNAAGLFAIDAATGTITTTQALDHEAAAQHILTVEVTDSATPGLTDTATITIDVGDINEAPTVGDQTFALDENQLAGAVVGTVAASDPDAANTLSYAITGGNAAGLFAIDAASGAITTTQALDHEAAAQHVLTVEVTDSATPGLTDTATITIDVGDLNEAPTDSRPGVRAR